MELVAESSKSKHSTVRSLFLLFFLLLVTAANIAPSCRIAKNSLPLPIPSPLSPLHVTLALPSPSQTPSY
ncbi:hypothetical protein E2C01_057286 [Portunus trituberculatus]|uniref:Uncharacterized protein n=1 Tax=Portunus trituberculatus TaxID=210409 RepID=A0A5B7GWD6_PORTR|nr:hypothetical protein [Portunus trituberculatus]